MKITKRIKYKFLRYLIKWRIWRKKINNKIIDVPKLTPREEKFIKYWKILLRDESTKIYFSQGIRQISNNNIVMIFSPGHNNDYIITIMHITDNSKNLYEIHIPEDHADKIGSYFDNENNKRMIKAANDKLNLIDKDIDSLLEIEEKKIINYK